MIKPKSSSTKSMNIFLMLWIGQLVSTLGSGLTGFALGIWVYQQTGSATLFALNLLAFGLPNLLVSPLAGALVDRWDRRWVMIMSDAGAGLSTLILAILYLTGHLQVWQVYILTAMYSAFTTFMWPAFSAVTTLLVSKEQLGRAGGLVQIGEAMSNLISPAVAGVVLVKYGLAGVVLADFITFLVAVITTLLVYIPRPPQSVEGLAARGSLFSDFSYGWKYITSRPGLVGLLSVFASTNLLAAFFSPLIVPMLLKITSADRLGFMFSALGMGMLVGTLMMSAWGGPKRRIHGVLGFMIVQGLFSALVGVTPSIIFITITGFFLMLSMPVVNASSQAIWQTKVAPDLQGRVFAVRRMIAWSAMPVAYVLAGPLSDKVFEPLLMPGGALASSLGPLLGVGPGRGTGLLFILDGLLMMLVPALAYLLPHLRNLEDEIPDAAPSLASLESEPAQPAAAPTPAD